MSNPITIFEDQFAGVDTIEEEDMMTPFTCMLCIGIAINPCKCDKCETIYCKDCIPKSYFDKSIKTSNYGNADQRPYACFKMCGSKKLIPLTRIERNILNTMTFTCQHADDFECDAKIKYCDMKSHLKNDCKNKIEFAEDDVCFEDYCKLFAATNAEYEKKEAELKAQREAAAKKQAEERAERQRVAAELARERQRKREEEKKEAARKKAEKKQKERLQKDKMKQRVEAKNINIEKNVMIANLPNLFAEEDEEVDQDIEWRFVVEEEVKENKPVDLRNMFFNEYDDEVDTDQDSMKDNQPVIQNKLNAMKEESESDVDMGGLFGDDDDY